MAASQDKLQKIETASKNLAPASDQREFNRVLRSKSAEYERQVLNEMFDALGLDATTFSKFDGKDGMTPKEVRTVREIQRLLNIDVDGDIGAATKKAIYDFAHKGLDQFKVEANKKSLASLSNELSSEQFAHEQTRKELNDELQAHGKTKGELVRERQGVPGTKHGETKAELKNTQNTLASTQADLDAEQNAAPGKKHANTKYLKSEAAEALRLDQNLRKATASGYGSLPGGWDRFDEIVKGSSGLKEQDIKKFEKAFIEQAAHILAREEAIKSGQKVTNGQYEQMAKKHSANLTNSVNVEQNVAKRLEALRTTAAKSMDTIVDTYCRRAGLTPESVTLTNSAGVDYRKDVFRLNAGSMKAYEVASKINSRVDHDNAAERFFFRLVGRNVTEHGSGQANDRETSKGAAQEKEAKQAADRKAAQEKKAKQAADRKAAQEREAAKSAAEKKAAEDREPAKQKKANSQKTSGQATPALGSGSAPTEAETLSVKGLAKPLGAAPGHGSLMKHLRSVLDSGGEVEVSSNKLSVTDDKGTVINVQIDEARLFSNQTSAAEADRILAELKK